MSTATATVGKFVWHEQVSGEPKKRRTSTARLFGWGVERCPAGRDRLRDDRSDGQTHGGYGQAMEGAPPPTG